jgi:hypothetical protein
MFDSGVAMLDGVVRINQCNAMKRILTLFAALWVVAANAQNTGGASANSHESPQSLLTAPSTETLITLKPSKPNEITAGRITLSGIVVEAVKIDNPLQLINPFAPASYGSAEDNTVRDPLTGKASGLKVFAIRF